MPQSTMHEGDGWMQGRIQVHPRGFGFVVADGDSPSAFVAPPDLNRFLTDDVVSCRVEETAGRRTARDLTLLERPRQKLFGAVVVRAGRNFLRVDRLVANTDWALDGQAPEGSHVVAHVVNAHAALLEHVADADAEVVGLLCRHNLEGRHRAEVLAEADTACAPGWEGRRDLRNVVTVTIDGPDTRDIDDALIAFPPDSDGAVRVIVAIADVGSVVARGTLLDEDARQRGTSIYLPGQTFPMLPRRLSEDILSLNEGEDRPAVTVEMRIDAEGGVTAVDIHEAVVRSTARLTYDNVTRFLDEGDGNAVPTATHDALRILRAASARLSQARAERGGRDVEREEISVRFDEQGSPTHLEARRTDVAHVLVERLMVAANEAVARFLVERGLPGVFRVHEAPTPERTRALADAARALGVVAGFSTTTSLSPRALAAFDRQIAGTRHERLVDGALRRLLGPARYSTVPSMHFGLAAPLYLHFTSPIRRYADLAVHRILRAYLHGTRAFSTQDVSELETLCVALNDLGRRAARAETERERCLVARLFIGRIGHTFGGVVVGNKPQGALILLDGAMALLPGPARPLGEALSVVVTAADDTTGRIDVRAAEPPDDIQADARAG